MAKSLIAKEVRELKPKDTATKYYGPEPLVQTQPITVEEYKSVMRKFFNWYNYFYDYKNSKDFLIDYLEHNNRPKDSKRLRKATDNQFVPTVGFMARMTMRGLELNEIHKHQLETEIQRLIGTSASDDAEEVVSVSNRPNVQEIMRDRTLEAGGELEGLFDEFLLDGAKKEFESKVMDELSKRNILPQHVPLLVKAWQDKLNEFETLQKGKDKDLNEAYSKYGKTQIKNIIKYVEQNLSDLNAYVSVKKANKTPRKKKLVSPEKRVSKLKYCKAYTEGKLKLESVSPVKLIGATEAWVYDTARRKLHHYIADSYSKEFTVKGNTIIGFDTKESEIKTLRKPEEQIKEIMGGKPAARKFFKDIKAVATTPKGRFNEDMIILKAF